MDYKEKAQLFAKELTMEYINEAKMLNKCADNQEQIDKIANIFENYYNAILNNEKFKSLL